MKTLARFFAFTVALMGLTFTMCKLDSDEPDPVITYTAVVDGSATAASTAITFTFATAFTGLAIEDITLTNGTGQATTGALARDGDGRVWKLGIAVQQAGNVQVKISREGIEAEEKTVTVYMAGEKALIGYEAEVNGSATEPSTAITFTFEAPVAGLTRGDIILAGDAADGGAVAPGTLALGEDGTVWTLGITVRKAGTVKVQLNNPKIETGEKTLTVYKGLTDPIDLYLSEGFTREEWTGQGTAEENWVLNVEEQSTVYLAAYKDAAQTITVGGQDRALVSAAIAVDGLSARDGFAIFAVQTGDLVFDGGTRTFTLNVSEAGALPRTVTVILNVNTYEIGAAVFKLVERDENDVEYLERVGGNFDGFVAAFEWVETNAQEDTEYTIRVEKDELNLPRLAVSLNKAHNAALRLRGTQGASKILQHGNTDALVNKNSIYVSSRDGFFQLSERYFDNPIHITFILGNNITLKGVGQGNLYSPYYDHLITLYDNATLTLEPGSLITEYVGRDTDNAQPILIELFFNSKTNSQVHIKGGTITNCTFYNDTNRNALIKFRENLDELGTDAIYKAAGVILHLSGNTNNYVGGWDGSWWYDLSTAEEIRVSAQE